MQDPRFVKEAFRAIAGRYVVTNHVLSAGIDVLWRNKVARLVRESGAREILDLATGSGDLAATLLKRCPGASVVGADFCLPMLAQARRRGLRDLVVADGMRLPFGEAAFDAVTVGFGLRNMESWPDAVAEMARVIRPGGGLFVLDFSLPESALLRRAYRLYLHRIMPAVAGLLTGQRAAYDYLCGSIERFPSGQDMLALLETNGFAGAGHHPLSGGIAAIYTARRSSGNVAT
ncbi:bifunctional demethylmenaquinone methyltransferase/2-methoxy-6-polyprenyl-1,4-benzoquinol methylase UbiE [soil metagenome]